MSNKSRCHFQNTLTDFRDLDFFDDELSKEEHNARRLLIIEMMDFFDGIGVSIDNDEIGFGLLERK